MRPKQQKSDRARMPYKRSSRISRHFWSPDFTRVSGQKEFFNSHGRYVVLNGFLGVSVLLMRGLVKGGVFLSRIVPREPHAIGALTHRLEFGRAFAKDV